MGDQCYEEVRQTWLVYGGLGGNIVGSQAGKGQRTKVEKQQDDAHREL